MRQSPSRPSNTKLCVMLIVILAQAVTQCTAGELKVVFTSKKGDLLVDKFITSYRKLSKNTRIIPLYAENMEFITILEKKPDLIVGDSRLISDNLAIGIYQNLNKYIPANMVKDIIPGYLDAYSVGKRLYALPIGGQCTTLLYNKRAFKKAGLPAPDGSWTWEQGFIQAGKKLTKVGFHSIVGLPQMNFTPLIYGYGGQLTDKSLKKIQYTEKPSLTAINLVIRLHKERLASQVDWSTVNRDNPKTWPFFDGKSAMTTGPGLPMEDREAQEWVRNRNIDMEVGWTYYPKGPKGAKPPMEALTVALFTTSKNTREATEALKNLCTAKGQLLLFDTEKYLPATYSSIKDTRVQKAFGSRFLKYYEGGRARDLKPELRHIEGILWRDVTRIITGEGTMKELLDNAKGEASDLLAMTSYDF